MTRGPNRNRHLQTCRAPLKRQTQGTSLFKSVASNQRGCPEIVHGRFMSGCQRVRGGIVAVKEGEYSLGGEQDYSSGSRGLDAGA